MEKTQREYYLNEQLKAIQKNSERLMREKTKCLLCLKRLLTQKMPKLAKEKCLSELKKLKINESNVSRSHRLLEII